MAITYNTVEMDQNGHELAHHGTAQLPAAFYYDDLKEAYVPWHWHEELEAIVIPAGGGLLAGDTEKYVVRTGEGFFANSGVLHAAWNRGEEHCRFHSVVFHPRLVGAGLDSIFWQKYVQPVCTNPGLRSLHLDGSEPWHRAALDCIEAAWQAGANEEPGYEFRLRSALSELIYILYCNMPPAVQRPSEREGQMAERIKLMLQYIQEHYAEPVTVAQIAGAAMVSESECLRCFRTVIGTPPIRYLKQLRLQRAAELLRTTDEKVAVIGAECGFQDASYFIRTFRAGESCTPAEYREAQRIKQTEKSHK